jgi:hypothetical protein
VTAARTGIPTSSTRRESTFPNNSYFYIRDPEWRPAFIETITYAPWPVWVYLDGHEWAKQQAAGHGIEFAVPG